MIFTIIITIMFASVIFFMSYAIKDRRPIKKERGIDLTEYFNDKIDWKFINYLTDKFTKYEDEGHGIAIGVGVTVDTEYIPKRDFGGRLICNGYLTGSIGRMVAFDTISHNLFISGYLNVDKIYHKPVYYKCINYDNRSEENFYRLFENEFNNYKRIKLVYIISTYNIIHNAINDSLLDKFFFDICGKVDFIYGEIERDSHNQNLIVVPNYKKSKKNV